MTFSQLCVGLIALILLLHVYWALGGQRLLPSTIPSDPSTGKTTPEPGRLGATLVALVLLHALFTLGVATQLWPSPWSLTVTRYSLWIWTGIFLVRVIGDFRWLGAFKRVRGTAFARADDWLFTPLCATIALGFTLTLLRL